MSKNSEKFHVFLTKKEKDYKNFFPTFALYEKKRKLILRDIKKSARASLCQCTNKNDERRTI